MTPGYLLRIFTTGLVLVVALALGAGCDADMGEGTVTLNTGVTTTITTSDVSATATVMDTGDTTTSTTPASVPALESGITPEQVLQLVGSKSQVPATDWELRESKNLGDWAVAKLYTDRFPAQMDERGVAAVFEKSGNAWFFKDRVSLSDSSNQQTIELANMGAPEEVWRYFGFEPTSRTMDQPILPDDMPADFGFIAEWWRNSLDTFAGTFTKDLVVGPPFMATAGLKLTKEEMEKVYQELVAINVLNYPAQFAPPYAEVTTPDTEVFVSTVINYRLHLVAAGVEKDIYWRDTNGSTTREAVALRDWFKELIELIVSKPEYEAMPPARGAYL